jgi:hypothetical protein
MFERSRAGGLALLRLDDEGGEAAGGFRRPRQHARRLLAQLRAPPLSRSG